MAAPSRPRLARDPRRSQSYVASPAGRNERRAAQLVRQWLRRLTLPGTLRRPAAATTELEPRDLVWASATALLAAAVFATTLTAHAQLGDAPESVAGIRSLGILHAPGYPTYVLAARLFTLLVPVGGLEWKVNLFSLVCGALTIGSLQLLCRRLGAGRPAASIAALCVATGAGFWFLSGYAKHDVFSGLMALLALHLAIPKPSGNSPRRILALGVAIGVGLGSSWPLMVLILPAVAVGLRGSAPRPHLTSVAAGLAVCVLVVAGWGAFVMVRAGAQPRENWGGATTVTRLVALVDRADFRGAQIGRALRQDKSLEAVSGTAGLPSKTLNVLRMLWLELGPAGILLAFWGLAVMALWRRSRAGATVAAALVVSLLGAAQEVGPGSKPTYNVLLFESGFLLATVFCLGVLVALGVSDLATRVGCHGRFAGRVAVTVALALALVAPQVIRHEHVVRQAAHPSADRVGDAVLAEAPHRAVALIWGWELTQPLVMDQVLHGVRPDVVVVAADALPAPWYREQVARRLGVRLPPRSGVNLVDAQRFARELIPLRPVVMDASTAEWLAGAGDPRAPAHAAPVAYRPLGLLEEAQLRSGIASTPRPSALARALQQAEATAGLPGSSWQSWPNQAAAGQFFVAAALEVSLAYYRARDLENTQRWLEEALRIDPRDSTARGDLDRLAQQQFQQSGLGG